MLSPVHLPLPLSPLQFWHLGAAIRKRSSNDPDTTALLRALLQCCVAVAVGLHYYVCVFERAVLDLAPTINAWSYLSYTLLFAFLVYLTRTKPARVQMGKQK